MEVIEFKSKEPKDLPEALRKLARAIDVGELTPAPTSIQWVMLDDEGDEMYIGGAGDLGNVYEMSGVFLKAASLITDGDEEDDG